MLVSVCYVIQYGETDLLFACKENDLRIVKKILSKGADPNIPNMVSCFFINKDTVEPPNKGHYGANGFVPCREIVPISEVK